MRTVVSQHTYHLERLIGRGGMGEVYKGWYRDAAGAPVECAVKFLHEEFAQHQGAQSRFVQEALLTWRFAAGHQNLVALRDYDFSDPHRPFVVLDFIDGPNLGQVKDKLKGHYGLIQALAYDVLCALEHLHGCGLVHRDVSPGNIMIAPDGVGKLTDLGLAKGRDDAVTFVGRGAARYAAPEVVGGETYTAASDLYSFGVVLYELIGGTLPGPQQALADDAPGDVRELVHGLLASDPHERLTLAGAAALVRPQAAAKPKLRAVVEEWQHQRDRRVSGAKTALASEDNEVVVADRLSRPVAAAVLGFLVAALLGVVVLVVSWPDERPRQPPAHEYLWE